VGAAAIVKEVRERFFSEKTKLGRLRTALFGLYQKYLSEGMIPTSAQFLNYELEHMGVVSKNTKAKQEGRSGRRWTQDAGDALTDLREKGFIPWEHIKDRTRVVQDFRGAPSIKQWMLDVLPQARLDGRWNGAGPLILTESESLAGVLENLADEYAAPIAAVRGHCRGFLETEIIPRLQPKQDVIYFGDLDKSGHDIEGNTRLVLERAVGRLRWKRLALTRTQADDLGLKPIWKYDKRDRHHYEAIETEALGQSRIFKILRDHLNRLCPERIRKEVHEREIVERAKMERTLRRSR
jgi:hypothetical protein